MLFCIPFALHIIQVTYLWEVAGGSQKVPEPGGKGWEGWGAQGHLGSLVTKPFPGLFSWSCFLHLWREK
jgi:hypothetical protein